jgi:dUTP pyrophosphatase
MKVKFKKLKENAKLPTKGSVEAGAYDVYATSIEYIGRDTFSYGLGFAVEIPNGYRLMIVPRSSFTKTNYLMQNTPAIIDSDFRAEISLRFRSLSATKVPPYGIGERIAQCYLEKVIDIEFEETSTLTDSERGSGGYGSTGK